MTLTELGDQFKSKKREVDPCVISVIRVRFHRMFRVKFAVVTAEMLLAPTAEVKQYTRVETGEIMKRKQSQHGFLQ